jgi:hypothetical protein
MAEAGGELEEAYEGEVERERGGTSKNIACLYNTCWVFYFLALLGTILCCTLALELWPQYVRAKRAQRRARSPEKFNCAGCRRARCTSLPPSPPR